jgi:hypothetical protein
MGEALLYHRVAMHARMASSTAMTARNPDDEDAIQRVEDILARMGWSELDLAKDIYRELDYQTPKGVTHWFNRSRRFPSTRAIRVTCRYLGVDPAYVIGYHDDLDASADPRGHYALASREGTKRA